MVSLYPLEGRTPGNQPVELTWSPTWDDEPDDFLGRDAGAVVARVYHLPGVASVEVAWRCFLWFPAGNNTTQAGSRREALLKVEGLYNAWRGTQDPA